MFVHRESSRLNAFMVAHFGYREYRYSDRKPILDFVVFCDRCTTVGNTGAFSSRWHDLELPNGRRVHLPPADWQLAEVDKGQLQTSDQRVSFSDFSAFLDSGQPWTLANLIEFRDQRQATP